MIHFENKYFRKIKFTPEQIRQYFRSAIRDLKIAQKSPFPEVIFKFSYDALLKFGIGLIAQHGFRVRSVSGHHIKILEKTAQILKNSDIEIIGNKMRQNRNFDIYSGGFLISEKDAKEYLKFVKDIFETVFKDK